MILFTVMDFYGLCKKSKKDTPSCGMSFFDCLLRCLVMSASQP